MSTLSLRLPESLHQKLRELAERDEVSINQLIATAVAEKTSALLTVDYLKARAQRADRRAFDRVLAVFLTFLHCPATNCPAHTGRLARRCSRRAARSVRPKRRSWAGE